VREIELVLAIIELVLYFRSAQARNKLPKHHSHLQQQPGQNQEMGSSGCVFSAIINNPTSTLRQS